MPAVALPAPVLHNLQMQLISCSVVSGLGPLNVLPSVCITKLLLRLEEEVAESLKVSQLMSDLMERFALQDEDLEDSSELKEKKSLPPQA